MHTLKLRTVSTRAGIGSSAVMIDSACPALRFARAGRGRRRGRQT
jgi:hypothetical protein